MNTRHGRDITLGPAGGPGALRVAAMVAPAAFVEGSDADELLTGTAEGDDLYGRGGNDTLQGGDGDDWLVGGTGSDLVDGGSGNDYVVAEDGDAPDTLDGGAGRDTLYIRVPDGTHFSVAANLRALSILPDGTTISGFEKVGLSAMGTGAVELAGGDFGDTLSGGAGPDVLRGLGGGDNLQGNDGDDTLNGAGGRDRLDGGTGDDRLDGGSGNDGRLWGGPGADTILGGDGDDHLSGHEGDDLLLGEEGNDLLSGDAGRNTLLGGAGDDALFSGAWGTQGDEPDSIDGGDGIDRAFIDRRTAPQGVVLSLADVVDGVVTLADGTVLRDVESVMVQGAYEVANTVTGGPLQDFIRGGNADDALHGGAGNDTLDGHRGHDTLAGGAGDDEIMLFLLEEPDAVDGGDGVDLLNLYLGSAVEPVELLLAVAPETPAVLPGGGTVVGVERYLITATFGHDRVETGRGQDVLAGSGGDDSLDGGGGGDFLNGGAGHDSLLGGAGDDTLAGLADADTLVGGAGNDHYLVTRGDLIFESSDGGTDDVETGTSFTLGNEVENLQLTGYGDRAGTGNKLANVLLGNAGDNRLLGRGGDDLLQGSFGADELNGGQGSDTLSGGGSNGPFVYADEFVFDTAPGEGNSDFVTDFEAGLDRIVLDVAAFPGIEVAGALDPARFRAGEGVQSAATPEERLLFDSTTGTLYYDADGSAGPAEATIVAVFGEGEHPQLTAADFFIRG